MSMLGDLSQAWVSAEAALPLGWRLTGLRQFGAGWVAFSNGPGAAQHIEAIGRYAEQALARLSEGATAQARQT